MATLLKRSINVTHLYPHHVKVSTCRSVRGAVAVGGFFLHSFWWMPIIFSRLAHFAGRDNLFNSFYHTPPIIASFQGLECFLVSSVVRFALMVRKLDLQLPLRFPNCFDHHFTVNNVPIHPYLFRPPESLYFLPYGRIADIQVIGLALLGRILECSTNLILFRSWLGPYSGDLSPILYRVFHFHESSSPGFQDDLMCFIMTSSLSSMSTALCSSELSSSAD